LNSIHLASFTGTISLMELLLKKGANIKAKTKEGLSALHMAA